jgi:hypothetical protein
MRVLAFAVAEIRRTLALQLGTQHRDYRSLRTAAVSRSSGDEDFESVDGAQPNGAGTHHLDEELAAH